MLIAGTSMIAKVPWVGAEVDSADVFTASSNGPTKCETYFKVNLPGSVLLYKVQQ